MSDGKNTRIVYLYRDGGNYKRDKEVVVAGSLTYEQVAPYLEGDLFIASEVGLPDPQLDWEEAGYGFPTEDDHVYCELYDGDLEPTDDPPTLDVTAAELLARFERTNGKWDVKAATKRLGIFCKPVAPAATKVVRFRCEEWPGWAFDAEVPAEATPEQLGKLARRVALRRYPSGQVTRVLGCDPARPGRPAMLVEEVSQLEFRFWLDDRGRWHLVFDRDTVR